MSYISRYLVTLDSNLGLVALTRDLKLTQSSNYSTTEVNCFVSCSRVHSLNLIHGRFVLV